MDDIGAATHAFAIVHQQWADHAWAKRSAGLLGATWEIRLAGKFLTFCQERGIEGGKIHFMEDQAWVKFGRRMIYWGSRVEKPEAAWPDVIGACVQ